MEEKKEGYYQRNKEKLRKYQREYNKKNRRKINEYRKEYQKEYYEKELKSLNPVKKPWNSDDYNKANAHKFDGYCDVSVKQISPDRKMNQDDFVSWYKKTTPKVKRREMMDLHFVR